MPGKDAREVDTSSGNTYLELWVEMQAGHIHIWEQSHQHADDIYKVIKFYEIT